MQIIARPSPNFNERAGGAVDMLVLHYTGMISREHAMARLCDPKSQASAHYLIDEEGRVYQMLAEERRAWHAGVSCWAGERDVNSCSIGIELVNPGHDLDYRNFPPRQMEALAQLCLKILSRHPIPASRVLGHSDVAPGRKRDPGEKLDWAWLAGQGVGIWPGQTAAPAAAAPDILEVQKCLARFGYDIPQTGIYGTQTRAVITAFQRHFRPGRVDGVADAQGLAILKLLLS
ncbi:MAG: N-acetylmuramoyl-L-alanine amidase [Alphaproteobacteria bacterium]|nr:N-acetylmuramoyl-L-alanine amidase [Alphaproteobacteria bacterium]